MAEDEKEDLLLDKEEQVDKDDAAAKEDADFFLDVDERHRYKTREDVIKAITESGSRIGELSAWEKEVAEQFGGLSPKEVANLLDELITRRDKEKAAAAAKETPAAKPAEKTFANDEEKKRHEANLAYLKENGFLTKEQVDNLLGDLKKEIAGLKEGTAAQSQERFNQRVEQGESYIGTLAKEVNLSEKGTKAAIKYITGCLGEANDPDGKLFGQFMRGGTAMQNTLKALFDEFADGVGIAKVNAKGTYQSDKEKAAGTKPLPRGGAGSEKPNSDKEKTFVGKSDPELHNKAFELMQKELRRQGIA